MGAMHLVAFHGYPLDRRIWEPLAGRAAAGTLGPITAVFAPDFRGRGTSLRPAAPAHAMSLLADDMAEEISHALPAGEPFLLAGLSMGGYVAFEFVTVSYTHLRAHETRHDLVCRLLLEK